MTVALKSSDRRSRLTAKKKIVKDVDMKDVEEQVATSGGEDEGNREDPDEGEEELEEEEDDAGASKK